MKKILLVAAIVLSVLASGVVAVTVRESCLNDTHKLETFEYVLTEDGTATAYNYTQTHLCQFNCTNGQCSATDREGDVGSMYIVYATGIIMLLIGTFMGNLFGKIFKRELPEMRGFSVEVAAKFLFFFIGLYLIRMSMGMAQGVSRYYGGSIDVAQGTMSVINIMGWSLWLFLIVFLIELVWTVMGNMRAAQEVKKWG